MLKSRGMCRQDHLLALAQRNDVFEIYVSRKKKRFVE